MNLSGGNWAFLPYSDGEMNMTINLQLKFLYFDIDKRAEKW